MMRLPLNSATTSKRVLSFPTTSCLQLPKASTQSSRFHLRAGFFHGDSSVRTKSFTWTDGVFRGESGLVRRASGSAFLCTARKSYGDTATLYFDGSSEGLDGPGGGGACLLHPNGSYIWRGYRFYDNASPTIAEYGGLNYGLERAIDAGIKYLTIYGDSDEVIEHMQGKRKVKYNDVKTRLSKAKKFTKQFQNFKFEVISRKQNSRANQLARKASAEDRVLDKWS